MGNNRKVCQGLYTVGARNVFRRPRKLRWKSVADVKKLCSFFLPFINVQTLRIGDADSYPYFSNKEIQYVFLDKLIKTRVLAAQNNQPMPISRPSKKPVKKLLHCCIKKEYNYAAPKNVRFDKQKPVRDISVPTPTLASTLTPNLA